GVLALFPILSRAQDAPDSSGQAPEVETRKELGYGVGAVVASVLYSPLKVTYAGLGLLTGGLGYVLSAGRTDVANSIIFPAVKGNYVITPNHLKGQEPVVFIGPPPPDPELEQEATLNRGPTQH
ncbi:MAG: hypothetical protein ACREQW_03635, partial [Candidatus Binatia bacterium]